MPMSDVTSIIQPTNDGNLCALPYRVGNFTWDMYFCNKGYCPTAMNTNSACALGKFGSISLLDFTMYSYQLKSKSGFIDGINEQCLIYYYYMANSTRNSITVLKQDINGVNETIDNVTNAPYNGWIKQMVSFFAVQSNYTIFFDVQKISGGAGSHAGLDEISIQQGYCNEIATTSSIIPMTSKDTTLITTQSIAQTTTESIITSTTTTETTLSTSSTTSTLSTTTTSTIKTTSTTSSTISSTIISTNVSPVDITSTETNSSDITQIMFTTQYHNSTILQTTITSSIKTSSITIINTITSPTKPSNKILIIVLSTVIPISIILLIIGIILWRKSISKSSVPDTSPRFTNLDKHKNRYSDLELDSMI
ncbi:hypothetical protein I4U23_006247 [Adineta vaga]|nr:hypothetical protein I4U23_006247 [Adineta vaga]